MHISTSLNVFEIHHPIGRQIRRCREAGFLSLDFNYWDYQETAWTMTRQEEEAWAWNIREAADLHGVRFTQMHGPVHGPSFREMVMGLNVESFLEMAERSLRTAAILGVPWVVFHPGQVSLQGEEPYREVLDYNVDFYRKLLPVMERTGVGIALENIFDRTGGETGLWRRIYCGSPEELSELLTKLDHPLFGACWDTGHGHRQGLRQGPSIRMLGKRLKALHIQDNDGNKDQHLLPFLGTIDWKDVMSELREIGYEGDFTYEAHMSIRVLPDELRDAKLAYAAETAKYITAL
ncbi:sugar phosphate isomerase/epimerase family protein [Paenibacillus macerans]|uniref:sugar phosphate isomerase/epimerase family protein n=1 Tax=Paenibacillus macerans TaxID=44252 RepID=UPI003D313B20